MKRIFTLLFCVGALALASHANTPVDRCIDFLLTHNASTNITAAQLDDLDANHDGVINMDDLTTLINQEIAKIQAAKAPAHHKKSPKLQGKANRVAKFKPISRTIRHASDMIDKKVVKEQQN